MSKHELYDVTLPPTETGDPVVIGEYDDETETIEWNVDPNTVRSVTSSTRNLDLRAALNTTGPVAFMRRGPNGAVIFELPVDEAARALEEMVSGKTPDVGNEIAAEQQNGALGRALKILNAKGTFVVEVEGRIVDARGNSRAIFSCDLPTQGKDAFDLVALALRTGRVEPLGDVDEDGNYTDTEDVVVDEILTTKRGESFSLPSNPRRLTLWQRVRLLRKLSNRKG